MKVRSNDKSIQIFANIAKQKIALGVKTAFESMKVYILFNLMTITTLLNCFGQEKDENYNFSIEIFPQVAFFRIYSAQMIYEITRKDHLILGFTYLNNYYPQKKNAIGQFNAPTIPIGYRRYLWQNLNIEGQLWPAYNFYKDLTQDRFYNGFDLVGSIRFGYRFDIKINKLALYSNIQIENLFGIYKGNKPENFDDVNTGIPVFPALSIGYKW